MAPPYETIILMAICVAVFLWSRFGTSGEVLEPLFIDSGQGRLFGDVRAGQWWRLLTPIFIHFGLIHIAFNLSCVWSIGALVERKIGAVFLGAFVVIVGIVSNVAQYLITHAVQFGGMSGVIYGLFGYLWVQGQFNPRFGRYLSNQSVVILLAWFVACWIGLLGAIANWAHTFGIITGVLWGFAHIALWNSRRGARPAPGARADSGPPDL